MPLDTRIAMGVQPLDVAGAIGRGMELRDMRTRGQMQEQQLAQAQQTMQRQQRLRDLTTGLKTNEERLDAMRQGGFLDEANDFESKVLAGKKTQADIDNTASQTGQRNFETLQKRVQATRKAISSLLALPNVTHDDIYKSINQQVNLGIITPEQGAEMARGLPGSQEALRPFLMTRAAEVASADAMFKSQQPDLQMQNFGGTSQIVDMNANTRAPGAPTSFKKTQTPDSIASNAVTMRGQNMTDARTREAASQSQFIPVDGVGLFVGDKRTGVARPVTDPTGKAVVPFKALTEGQAKANLFGARMKESDRIIGELADQGVTAPSFPQQVTGGNGVTGRIATAAANPQQQQVDQAQRDFINAVLRRESGAAIAMEEFNNARMQYFAQPGDSEQVLAQKARNRALAIDGMLAEVPEEKRTVPKPPARKGAPVPIKSDSDYDRLPSGTRFQAPDGSIRVKP